MKTKKLVILSVAIVIFCNSCGASGTKKEQTKVAISEVAKPIHLTTQEFNSKVADINSSTWEYLGDKPAVVDFYADWCGPCRMIAPSLEKLAEKYDGQVYIYKVDIDKEPRLAERFGISSIPSLLFIPMKGEPKQVNGAMPKFMIDNKIKSILLD